MSVYKASITLILKPKKIAPECAQYFRVVKSNDFTGHASYLLLHELSETFS